MKQTFKVQNIKCNGCANTVKSKLKEAFGEVEVNLEVEPGEITLEIDENQVEQLKIKMKSLGYPFVGETLSGFETFETKAKSFVSCAVGRMGE
jgi:copper chaperone CopZ